jgi:outer membrane receptor for monomeric catechols
MENTTLLAPIAKKVKLLSWTTNYNNKLKCDGFVHVDIAPPITPTWQMIEAYHYEIETLDNSHPPVQAELISLQIVPFHQLPNWYTYTSHGMSEVEYAEYMFKKYKNFTWETQVALYLYRKVFL